VEVERAFDDRQLVRAALLARLALGVLCRLAVGRGRRLGEEDDVDLLGVGLSGVRVRVGDLGELIGGPDEHGGGDAQLGLDRLLDHIGQAVALLGAGAPVGVEDDVAAVDVRTNIGVPECLDEPSQVGHRDLVVPADVDPSKQCHVRPHDHSLSQVSGQR
jgi:hypothetical protein